MSAIAPPARGDEGTPVEEGATAVDAPPARRRRRTPDGVVALGVGALTAAIAVIPQWRGEFFYYVGDAPEQYTPLWHLFGQQLRAGQWPTMDPGGWLGGNYAAEAMTGLWNPVNLLDYLVVSTFDNLSLAAFVVMVQFLALLAMGVFLLAREYGAGRVPAALVATAVPVSGFTLWYEAAGWPAGLMAFTWVTHFWWSARRHARGELNPIVPFLFGGLTITVGSPYGALGILVVSVAIGVELLLQRRWARLASLAVMAGCVAALAAVVFLPLLGADTVSARQELAGIGNDTFLVPDVGDLAASSSPTYTPAMLNWSGAVIERVPSTYFAWFVLPLLPWLRWDRLVRRRTPLASLFVVLGWYLLATLGPSNLWLFRWPVRLIEYSYLAVGVLFAVVLSAGLAGDHVRRRAIASAAVVAVGGYLAWAVRPADADGSHLLGVAIVGAATALAVLAYRRRGMRALGLVAVAGTVGVLVLQTSALPVTTGPLVAPAYDLPTMTTGAAEYQGTVLQLAALAPTTPEQAQTGQILFGNLARTVTTETVTSYSGIGFREFQRELCMDYRGAVCPEAFDRLWQPTGSGVDVPLIDALRVSTLVVQRSLRPDVADRTPPAGWRVADRTPVRAIWVRDHPLDDTGRVSWSSAGARVETDSSAPQREVVRYDAGTPGRLLFARLAWPGYTASVDGRAVETVDGPAGLLAVDVPAGRHTLEVSYRSPGLGAGAAAAAVAAGCVLVQAVGWSWQRRRRERSGG
jgi:hypothetical protein